MPDTGEGAGVVHLVRGDGRLVEVLADRFCACGTGVRPDFTKARPIDYGLAVAFGAYEAAADATFDDGRLFGSVFDPEDYDGTQADPHATAGQLPFLDRAVNLLNRVGAGRFEDEADAREWKAVIAGLRAETPGLYGCEWIHKGWDLDLHGAKMFAHRWLPDEAIACNEFWTKLFAKTPMTSKAA
jgi:hypothetical protein